MQTMIVEKSGVDPKTFIGKTPSLKDVSRVIDEPTLFKCGTSGETIALYLFLPESSVAPMREVSTKIKMSRAVRSGSQVPTQSAVFGCMPRVTFRADYCRFTAQSKEHPKYFGVANQLNEEISALYKEHFPEQYDLAMEKIAEVEPSWKYLNTPYLTCNVNVNHAIKYHTDAGNLDGFSNVLILKRGITGGILTMPEYGVGLSQRDRALLIFNGKKVLHGVTPISQDKAYMQTPYRASIVYYTLQGMLNCLSRQGETERSQDNRTTKEKVPTAERLENFRASAETRLKALERTRQKRAKKQT